ncbi:MAG: hypothetical protein LBH09_04715 [Peptococcaceae bacterium]|jgi:flagellar hook-associated protein 3 FlgL|nr:hypothetical protein [Peptococcaceae bacterium]
MRVSDRATARNYLKYLHRAQSKYAEVNQRIASGNRFTKLSDDVSAGSRVLKSRMDRYKAEKQLENTKEAIDELTVGEDALTSINTIVMYIHEKSVQKAKNDPTSEEGRKVLAQEIRAMMEEIVQHANAKYGNRFSFGGTNGYEAPFRVGADGRLTYNGIPMEDIRDQLDSAGNKTGKLVYDKLVDDGMGNMVLSEFEVPMDSEIYYDAALGIKMKGPDIVPDTAFKVSYSGPEVFGYGKDDDGVSNNIYNVLYEVQKAIDNYDLKEVEKWDTKLASLLEIFRRNLTDIGVKTNFLLDNVKRLEDTVDRYTAKIDDLMGVDDAEEATHQMMNDYVLKAVLQMGSRVIPLSLMDFIS